MINGNHIQNTRVGTYIFLESYNRVNNSSLLNMDLQVSNPTITQKIQPEQGNTGKQS